jgi:4-amino-4-deoxy-L-arabinose transferase-like glycosyltransferase
MSDALKMKENGLKAEGKLLSSRYALVLIAVGFLLRLGMTLILFGAVTAVQESSDSGYYVIVAQQIDRLAWHTEDQWGYAATGIAPLYPLFMAPFFALIPPDANPLLWVRLAQVLVDTGLIALVGALTDKLFGRKVALVALTVQALDPRYIYLAGAIQTELIFIPLVALSLLYYADAAEKRTLGPFVGSVVMLGLATLTRAVTILFPAVYAFDLLIRRESRQYALRVLGVLVGVFLLFVVPWVIRTSVASGEFVPIASSGFMQLWATSRDDGRDIGYDYQEQEQEDGIFEEEQPSASQSSGYVRATLNNILKNPLAYLGRIAGDVLKAYLQPYGTYHTKPGGTPSARRLLVESLRGEGSLLEIVALPGFVSSLIMYIWHFWAVIAGFGGVALAWRRGRFMTIFPLAGWIAYITAISAPLLIEARYVFPAMFALTGLGSYASVEAWEALRERWAVIQRASAGEEAVTAK